MTTPLPLPIRVLIKGPSTCTWISYMGGPRTDFNFPRVIERELLAHGHPVTLNNTAVLGSPTRDWFPTFEEDVATFSPDVIILYPGHYEMLHMVLPQWFERHSNRINHVPSRLAHKVRRKLERGMWRFLVKVQARIDVALPQRAHERRIRRTVADLKGYIEIVRHVGRPLVFVMETLMPADRVSEKWLPGAEARLTELNRRQRALVEEFDEPDVRWFPTFEIAEKRYGDDRTAATPDGFHYTPELHDDIGRAFAEIINEWAQGQPHLTTEPRQAHGQAG